MKKLRIKLKKNKKNFKLYKFASNIFNLKTYLRIIGLIGEPTPPVIGRGGAQNKNS